MERNITLNKKELWDVATTIGKNELFFHYIKTLKNQFKLKKKVTLIQCPTFSFDDFQLEVAKNRGYLAYPPRGLQSLMQAIEDYKLEVRILDFNFLLLEKLSHESYNQKVDLNGMINDLLEEYFCINCDASVVGISTGVQVPNIFGSENHPYIQILNYFMENKQHVVLTGGPIATLEKEGLLKLKLAHFIFTGEAENKFKFFIDSLFGGEEVLPIPGIFFNSDDGISETKGEIDFVSPTSNLIPTYDQIEVGKYNKVGSLGPLSRMTDPDKKYAVLQMIRGCRGKCTFCELIDFRGKKVAQYSPSMVLEEMRFLVKEHGIKHFEWLDDDLLYSRKAITEFLNGIIHAKLNITWAQNVGVIGSSLNRDILKLMVESGCVGFKVGIETGNDERLKQIRKPSRKKNFVALSELLPEFPSLFVIGLYIFGFENETYGQIYETIRFAMDLNLSWNNIALLQITKKADVDEVTPEMLQNALKKKSQGSISNKTNDTFSKFQKSLEGVSNYNPSKEVNRQKDMLLSSNKYSPKELFNLPVNEIHNQENLKELWFAANLLINFIDNKNLKPEGNPKYLIKWLKALILTYPTHPIMHLFLSLAYVVNGDSQLSRESHKKTQFLLKNSGYWQFRFSQYNLNLILMNPPNKPNSVYEIMNQLNEQYDFH